MIYKKYELISQTKKHHWKSRQVAKFQWVWSILIFNDFVWNNYILYFILMCLKNGQKLNNQKNSLKKFINFTCHTDFALICTISVGFAWNFRFWLQMELTLFVIYWPSIHNFFAIIYFRVKVNQKKILTKIKFTLTQKKIFVRNVV